MVAVVEPGNDDVAAFYESHGVPTRLAETLVQHFLHPGAGGIDDCTRLHLFPVRQLRLPHAVHAARRDTFRAHEYASAAPRGINGIGDHQARIVDAAVRIDEAMLEPRLQRRCVRRCVQPYGLRGGQHGAPGKMIVEKKPQADHPARPQSGHVRHDEARRPGEVSGDAQQDLNGLLGLLGEDQNVGELDVELRVVLARLELILDDLARRALRAPA